jgi:hypothetical protein
VNVTPDIPKKVLLIPTNIQQAKSRGQCLEQDNDLLKTPSTQYNIISAPRLKLLNFDWTMYIFTNLIAQANTSQAMGK